MNEWVILSHEIWNDRREHDTPGYDDGMSAAQLVSDQASTDPVPLEHDYSKEEVSQQDLLIQIEEQQKQEQKK